MLLTRLPNQSILAPVSLVVPVTNNPIIQTAGGRKMRARISSRISTCSSEAREHRGEPVLRETTYFATVNVSLARPVSRVRRSATSLIPGNVTNRLYARGYSEQGRGWGGMDVVSVDGIAFSTVFPAADESAKPSGGSAKGSGGRAKESGERANGSGRLAKGSGKGAKASGDRAKGSGSRAKAPGGPAKRFGERAKGSGGRAKQFGRRAKSSGGRATSSGGRATTTGLRSESGS